MKKTTLEFLEEFERKSARRDARLAKIDAKLKKLCASPQSRSRPCSLAVHLLLASISKISNPQKPSLTDVVMRILSCYEYGKYSIRSGYV